MFLGHLPRVPLAHLPSPLEEMRALARTLGGPRLFVKRDDATGLALGGNKSMIDAVRLVARSEGIVLDPVYSGKAMAGLIDLVRKGVLERDQTVCFIHTGGTPGLFAYPDCFAE